MGALIGDRETFGSSIPNLYIAGDYLTGPSTVIEAIARGRSAAENMAKALTGRHFRDRAIRLEETHITDRQLAWDFMERE
jgi:pyruvate/2-oxoglutarate dehydrogenase complex dihydrolipoamide dehydrogenase (E3) component